MRIQVRRNVRRLLAAVVVVAVVAAVVGDWVIHHWHLTGRAADVVVFVAAFVAIGALSYWFGREP